MLSRTKQHGPVSSFFVSQYNRNNDSEDSPGEQVGAFPKLWLLQLTSASEWYRFWSREVAHGALTLSSGAGSWYQVSDYKRNQGPEKQSLA